MTTVADRTRAGSALRFLLVGGTTVLIDAAVYAALDAIGVDYDVAKTISFLTGAVFAYFANWRFTFGGHRNRWSEILFVAVYLCALVINIALNGVIRAIAPESALVAALAFLVATGVSAVWNFVGMSLFVFRKSSTRRTPSDEDEPAPGAAPQTVHAPTTSTPPPIPQ